MLFNYTPGGEQGTTWVGFLLIIDIVYTGLLSKEENPELRLCLVMVYRYNRELEATYFFRDNSFIDDI